MTKPSRLGVWTGAVTLVGTLGLLPSLPATAAEQIEEVVVTGSYIKRDSFDSSSPLTVVDQTQIAENATPNLGEVLVNQTFNYGTDFQANTYAARAQGGNVSAANLRGLGTGATLDLVDGKRSIYGNLNSSVPQIAIERIDILKDGASAIYGTDAVAGVVNIVSRKNFSGAAFSAFYQQTEDDALHEQAYEFIAGSDTDDGHVTMAFSYKKRGELEQTERPEYLRGGFERSETGNPGRWAVPNRDATGALLPAGTPGAVSVLADPGCGAAPEVSPGGTDVGSKGNFLTGQKVGQSCRFHFGEMWNFMNPQEQYSFWGNYQFQFTDNLSNELDVRGNRLITDSRGSPQNPGGRTEEFPIVLGDHPGNPYRAFSDLDADGVIDPGEHLYAQDADGDGVPDRGTADVNGDGVPDVILAADPFDPALGIAFNEDVDVIALRILSKIGLVPGANQPSHLNADGSNLGSFTFDTVSYRVLDTLTYAVPGTSWEVA
ncbi:MAG: TonB-dependent receptor plug domain-containing protein, partial [Pseudomonadales bacterium]